MPILRLLIVDDEPKMLKALQRVLEGWSADPSAQWEIQTCESAAEALSKLESIPYQVVLSDIRIGSEDGVELLRQIKQSWPETEVVLMTAYATVESAIEAMKAGAQDYLIKPFKMDELKARLGRLEEMIRLRSENRRLRDQLARAQGLGELIGNSPIMEELRAVIRKLSNTDSTVLLRGESGTGKDLTARAIHYASERSGGPFVTASCSAIPERSEERRVGKECRSRWSPYH